MCYVILILIHICTYIILSFKIFKEVKDTIRAIISVYQNLEIVLNLTLNNYSLTNRSTHAQDSCQRWQIIGGISNVRGHAARFWSHVKILHVRHHVINNKFLSLLQHIIQITLASKWEKTFFRNVYYAIIIIRVLILTHCTILPYTSEDHAQLEAKGFPSTKGFTVPALNFAYAQFVFLSKYFFRAFSYIS